MNHSHYKLLALLVLYFSIDRLSKQDVNSTERTNDKQQNPTCPPWLQYFSLRPQGSGGSRLQGHRVQQHPTEPVQRP